MFKIDMNSSLKFNIFKTHLKQQLNVFLCLVISILNMFDVQIDMRGRKM